MKKFWLGLMSVTINCLLGYFAIVYLLDGPVWAAWLYGMLAAQLDQIERTLQA